MAGNIVRRHFHKDLEPVGVYSSAINFIAGINKTKDFADNPTNYEGLVYYDTTLNQLRTYDGSSWSPAGMSGASPGSLDDAANIGVKITVDGAMTGGVEIEATDAIIATNGQLLLLDNDDTGADVHCLECTNAGTAPSIIIAGQASSDDIQGTSDTWAVDSAGVATFTQVNLADDQLVRFGSSQDVTVGWDATQLEFIPSTNDYAVIFGDGAPRMDVKMWGSDTNASVTFDASANEALFNGYDIGLQDDDYINFGDNNDVTVRWDQTQLVVLPATTESDLHLGSTSKLLDTFVYGDLRLDGASAGVDILWDRSENTLEILDDVYVAFGTGDDVTFQWDQTNFEMYAAAADTPWAIGGTSYGFDMTYYHEGSGTVFTDYDGKVETHDGCDVWLKDNDYILFGDSATAGGTADNSVRYDSTGDVLEIVGGVLFEDDVQIGESGATNTLTIYGNATVSGSMTWGTTGSAGSVLALEDDESFTFGDASDVSIKWDQTNLLIEAVADDTGQIRIGSTNAMDFAWYDSDATDTFTLDAGASTCTLLNLGLVFSDATSTFTFSKPASNILNFNAGTANETVHIGASTNTDWVFNGGTATYDVHWDASSNTLGFLDDAVLGFGNTAADPDIQILWNRSELTIDGKASGEVIDIGPASNLDVKFNGGNAGRDMVWDASDNSLEFADQAILAFGTGDDLEFTANGTTATTTIAAGSTWTITDTDNTASKLAIGGTGGSHGLDIEINSITDGEDIQFDAANKTWIYDNIDVTLSDDDFLYFGDASDVAIKWVGSSSVLTVDGVAADKEIRFGSGTNIDVGIYANSSAAYVKFDTDDTAKLCTFEDIDLILMDDDLLYFGDASDVAIEWVGSSSVLTVDGAAADREVRFGSGTNIDVGIYANSSAAYVKFDTDDSAKLCTFEDFDLRLMDNDILGFGDDGDVTIVWDDTDMHISGANANVNVLFGDPTNMNLVICGENTAANVTFDTDSSAYVCIFEGFDLRINDADILSFGDSSDITATWTGGTNIDLLIDSQAADNTIQFGKSNNVDLIVYGDASTDVITFDTSEEDVRFNGFDLTIMHDDILNFGDSDEASISWITARTALCVEGGSANALMHFGYTNNLDIAIYGDNTADDVTFDTSDELCTFDGFDLHLNDSDILEFGDTAAGDITMTYVASATEFRIDGAAADKIIAIGKTNNQDIVIYGDTSTDAITFDTSAEMCTFNGFDITMNDDDIIKFGDSGADGSIVSGGTYIGFTITAGLDLGDGGTTNYTRIDSTGNIQQKGTAKLTAYKYNVTACSTSEAYSVANTQSGTVFTTRGATDAVTFTLPTVEEGLNYKFCALADQNMIIASNEGDNMVLPNDAAGDSVAYQTATEKIGGTCEVVCDGTSWFVFYTNFSDGVADVTVTTAT